MHEFYIRVVIMNATCFYFTAITNKENRGAYKLKSKIVEVCSAV